MKKLAIIGGTGLEDPSLMSDIEEVTMDTPYGPVAAPIKRGIINNVEIYLFSRHGHQHTIPPSKVNNRANIWSINKLQCDGIVATTACGSLREDIGRGHFVILDQFIDFTKHREVTFFNAFEPGDLKHTPMADPFDAGLRDVLIRSGKRINLPIHEKGTVVTIEGPRFSTRAESNMFRLLGADVINMSTAPEAILANELDIPYAAVAMSTDYDCWKEDELPVTWEEVLHIFQQNVSNVIQLLMQAIQTVADH